MRRQLAALLLATLSVTAPAAEDPAVAAVHQFLQQQTGSLGEKVDIEVIPPAAQFPDCLQARAFFPGKGQRRWGLVTVGLRCEGNTRSLRYLQARVTVTGHYWITARDLPADTPLSPSLLARKKGDLSQLPRHTVRDLEDIQGQVTRRPLARGTILQQSLLHTPPLVERRQTVSVEARGHGFRIAREGQALDSGAAGDAVRIRMPDSGTLQATVTGPGLVAVAP